MRLSLSPELGLTMISLAPKADRRVVDRLATKDSIALSVDRSLPPNQRSPRPRVTISLSLLLELVSRANDPNQFAVQ
jgi:hypothetical protein